MIRVAATILFLAVFLDRFIPGATSYIASLDRAGFTFGALSGFVLGLGVIVIGYRLIHNGIVEQDRRNDIAGVNKKHDARRI